jgi:DNA-directed RNA polymerase specialized sigma24 family protein
MPARRDDVTALLRAWGEGDEQPPHQLMPLVERELNRIARARRSEKRGGDTVRVSLDEAMLAGSQRDAHVDPRKGRVIELRFFGGLSTEETAAILDVSTKTVIRTGRLPRPGGSRR